MFTQTRVLISGKKTYLLAIAGIITLIVGWSEGEVSTLQAIIGVITALGAMSGRAALSKAADPSRAPEVPDKGITGNGGNFPRGVGLLLCLWALFVVNVRAEEPGITTEPQISPSAESSASLLRDFAASRENMFVASLRLALDYVAEHGEIGTGYGIALDGNLPGVLLTQKIDVWRWQVRRSEIGLGLVHATLFTFSDNDSDLELIGVGASWHWFKSPPWVADVQSLPVIRTLLFVKFTEFKLSPFLGLPAEDLIKGQFDRRRTIAGIGVSFRF